MRHAVHVCLVSDQPTPNLTPALDPRTRPDEVVLFATDPMLDRAKWIEQVLRPTGVKVETRRLSSAYDIEGIRDELFEFVAAREADDLALNATGGTKPMSIAGFEVFRGLDRPVFYVHPLYDRLVWLHHPGPRPEAIDLADRLKITAFLAAHGVRAKKRDGLTAVPAELRALTTELLNDPARYAKAVGTLNYLAATARGSLRSAALRKDGGRLGELIDRFERAGCLRRQKGRLSFPDEAMRFYVNGGWLENHVYATVFGLRAEVPAIQDLREGLEVAVGEVRNEIDVAFLADNRLYLVECKTKRFSRDSGHADESIYKLDTLEGQLGGLQARSMLVSYLPVRDADLDRARALDIRVCAGPELTRLRPALLEWLA